MKNFFNLVWNVLVEIAEQRAKLASKKGQSFYY